MPGNRALFDRAMEQSREAARQKNWDEALKQAVRALQEFSQDPDARLSVAVAFFQTGKYPQALQIFDELRKTDQANPFFLEYLARIHERTGNTAAAVQAYTNLADLQQGRRLNLRVVEALREVLRLRPEADEQRLRLARLLEESGSAADAASAYLELAQRRQSNLEEAIAFAETALRLDPASREAKEIIQTLTERLAGMAGAAVEAASTENDALAAPVMFGATGGLRSQQLATDRVIQLAQEHQEAGDLDAAIQQYERAIAMGTERSDVFYSLGLLYQDRGEHQRATDLLPRAAADEEYALSAHYMLGQSYQALGKLPQAASEYEQTIRLLPLDTIGKAESEDMIQMYESAAQIYTQLNDIARAASLYSTLATFLQSKRWGRERADEFRQKAKELTERNMFAKLRTLGTGALIAPDAGAFMTPEATEETMPETWGKIRPITDFLRSGSLPRPEENPFSRLAQPAEPVAINAIEALPPTPRPAFDPLTPLVTTGLDEVAERYVVASEKYAEQGLMIAAIDACLEVIRIDMEYLPIHLRMGEIYEREERREEALQKYQMLIDTYAARGEQQKSIDVYYRLIALSPDTTNTRARLAELLKNEQRLAEAAEQIVLVAGNYFRLGQTNKALEEFRRGLQWAPANPDLRAQYGQALFKLDRYEAALGEFRRAFDLDQQNPVHIARINMTLAMMGDQPDATWQSLATLLEQLRAHPHANAEIQAEYRGALLSADEPILHYILGIIQQSGDQHQSSLLEFEQAAALLDDDPDPLLDVLVSQAAADSYIALGQPDEARAQLQHCLEVPRPDTRGTTVRYSFATPLSQGELVRRMAEAYAAIGDLQGAEQALQRAKQHLPYDRAIYTKLADIYFQQGKLAEALAQLEELATHYESRQDLDRAIDALELGVKLAPNNIPIGSRLAKMFIRRGYLDKGIEHMSRVAEQQRKAGQLKDAVLSLQQVAEIYSTLGEQEAALSIFDKIVQIMPNDIETRQWLAIMHTLAFRTKQAVAEKKQLVRIYLQQRDLEGATEELFTIIALDQSDSEAHLQLGDVLMRREEYEQALRIYSRLAKMPNIEIARVEALQSAAKRMFDQQQMQRKAQPAS